VIRRIMLGIAAGVGMVLVLLVLLVFAIQPVDRDLNLSYASVPWMNKMESAVVHNGTLTLSDEDLTNLLKMQLQKRVTETHFPVTGAKLGVRSGQLFGTIAIHKWGIPVGVSFTANVQLVNQDILVTPTKYWIGTIAVSPATFQRLAAWFQEDLEFPAQIRLQLSLPSVIKLRSVQIKPDGLALQFSLNHSFGQ
jgi:hypothetical protein